MRSLVGRAAVQSLAPGTLLAGLGLALAHSAAASPAAPGSPDGGLVVETVAGFLAWWSCSTWALLCAADLWLFRTGTLHN